MRYFEYVVTYEDNDELDTDVITPITSEEILGLQWTRDWIRKKGDKATDDKAIASWVAEEWAVEISEKEYRKYFR
jgi:hypothetical protein